MKLWLSALVLSGFSVLGFSVLAQSPTVACQGPFDWSVDKIQATSPVTKELRGSVRIAAGRVVITADEADVQTGPKGAQEVMLRGNVHLSIAPKD